MIERLKHAIAKFRAHPRGYRIGIWALRFEKGCIELPLHRPGIKVDLALEDFGIKRSILRRKRLDGDERAGDVSGPTRAMLRFEQKEFRLMRGQMG